MLWQDEAWSFEITKLFGQLHKSSKRVTVLKWRIVKRVILETPIENFGEYYGYEPEERCYREGCKGTMQDEREGGCSCHINPPCGHCTHIHTICDTCDTEYEYQA